MFLCIIRFICLTFQLSDAIIVGTAIGNRKRKMLIRGVKQTMTDIVAIGELLVDMTAEDGAGRLYSANPGGAPANFAAAAAAAGADVALIAKVGDDDFGRMLIGTLENAGVDASGVIRDPDVFTTLAFVSLDETGDRSFSFARKPGADTRLCETEVAAAMPERFRALHFGSLSFTDEPARSAVKAAVKTARAKGALISYDPNYRPPLWKNEAAAVEAMRWGLRHADVVKLSGEEAALITGADDPAVAAGRIRTGYGCRLVFVTLGAEGCFYDNGACSGSVPAFEGIQTIDTTGAGDIFGGTALAKLLRLQTPPEALNAGLLRSLCVYACVAAGLSTGVRGGIASVPEEARVKTIFSQTYGNGADSVL